MTPSVRETQSLTHLDVGQQLLHQAVQRALQCKTKRLQVSHRRTTPLSSRHAHMQLLGFFSHFLTCSASGMSGSLTCSRRRSATSSSASSSRRSTRCCTFAFTRPATEDAAVFAAATCCDAAADMFDSLCATVALVADIVARTCR